mmetsp:Transcript_6952/g.17556  ORF Transcript_6952/g.17556 Transcript_6952/m.17556 type:complete len:230 (+) Transcript_6952:159-848(+)
MPGRALVFTTTGPAWGSWAAYTNASPPLQSSASSRTEPSRPHRMCPAACGTGSPSVCCLAFLHAPPCRDDRGRWMLFLGLTWGGGGTSLDFPNAKGGRGLRLDAACRLVAPPLLCPGGSFRAGRAQADNAAADRVILFSRSTPRTRVLPTDPPPLTEGVLVVVFSPTNVSRVGDGMRASGGKRVALVPWRLPARPRIGSATGGDGCVERRVFMMKDPLCAYPTGADWDR